MTRTAPPARPAAFLLFNLLLLSACSELAKSPTEPPVFEARGPVTAYIDDDFDAWDPTQWVAGDHPLGRGYLDPDNVSVEGDTLFLRFPAGTYDGGEIYSTAKQLYGVYEVRLRVARAPGSLTAFFLYEGGLTRIDEIDIEILGDASRTIMFTVWSRSRRTNHRSMQLGFDPTEGFHDYRIEFERKRVRFYADGVLMTQFTRGLPSSAMLVMANAWWPTWLTGNSPAVDQAAAIDWIRY